MPSLLKLVPTQAESRADGSLTPRRRSAASVSGAVARLLLIENPVRIAAAPSRKNACGDLPPISQDDGERGTRRLRELECEGRVAYSIREAALLPFLSSLSEAAPPSPHEVAFHALLFHTRDEAQWDSDDNGNHQ